MLKKMISGENLQLMKVSGRGEIFFSDFGAEVQIVQLENDSLTINTSNLLAFESTLQWDIKIVKPGMQMLAAGLSNVTVSGTGLGAISSFGTPFVLQVNEPTYVDVQAALAWSTSLQTDIKSIFKVGSLDRPGAAERAFKWFSPVREFNRARPLNCLHADDDHASSKLSQVARVVSRPPVCLPST